MPARSLEVSAQSEPIIRTCNSEPVSTRFLGTSFLAKDFPEQFSNAVPDVPRARARKLDDEMFQRAKELALLHPTGLASLKESGGNWRKMIRANRSKFGRVLADLEQKMKEGYPIDYFDRFLCNTWNRMVTH